MERRGVEWSGVEWSGVEWSGAERSGVAEQKECGYSTSAYPAVVAAAPVPHVPRSTHASMKSAWAHIDGGSYT